MSCAALIRDSARVRQRAEGNDRMTRHTKPQAAAMLLFTALAWGALFSVAKGALASIDAFHLSALRYVPAAIAMLAILAVVEGPRALRLEGNGVRLWIYGSLGFAGFSNLAFLGIAGTSPEHAAIIAALMPLVTALLTWLLRGRRPPAATLVAIVVAFAGVLLVITHGRARLPEDFSWTADAMVLAGVVCWVLYTMGSADTPGFSPLRYTGLSMAFGAASIVVLALAAGALGMPAPTRSQVVAFAPEIAYLSVVAGVLAVLAWNAGVGTLGAPTGSLFVNLVPVTAFAIAIAQGHRFGAVEIGGALLTIIALVGANIANRAPAATPAPVSGVPVLRIAAAGRGASARR
jgi:drug/metabolite transporter (DMT)-like permease